MEHGYEGLTTDQLETELTHLEQMVGVIRNRQAQLLREADRRQLPTADGSRSIIDWTAARLDVTHATARRLNTLVHGNVNCDGLSFDRHVALTRLAKATGKPVDVESLAGYDIGGVLRKVAYHRHVTPTTEQEVVAERFLAIQPTLDQSRWKLWGSLPGTDGALVEQALVTRGDNLPSPPEGATLSRGQRSADALVSMAMDTLDPDRQGEQAETRSGAMVTIVCDARDATITNGETGVSVVGGPRIGIQTLEEVLCDGTVEVVAIDSDGVPLGVGPASSTIPPRVRRYVLARDGGCTVDGCHSRYRLQPHHITHRAHGGTHHPANLTTLCWFHHHRVIHGMGYTIDPASPPMRRRLIKPKSGTDPP